MPPRLFGLPALTFTYLPAFCRGCWFWFCTTCVWLVTFRLRLPFTLHGCYYTRLVWLVAVHLPRYLTFPTAVVRLVTTHGYGYVAVPVLVTGYLHVRSDVAVLIPRFTHVLRLPVWFCVTHTHHTPVHIPHCSAVPVAFAPRTVGLRFPFTGSHFTPHAFGYTRTVRLFGCGLPFSLVLAAHLVPVSWFTCTHHVYQLHTTVHRLVLHVHVHYISDFAGSLHHSSAVYVCVYRTRGSGLHTVTLRLLVGSTHWLPLLPRLPFLVTHARTRILPYHWLFTHCLYRATRYVTAPRTFTRRTVTARVTTTVYATAHGCNTHGLLVTRVTATLLRTRARCHRLLVLPPHVCRTPLVLPVGWFVGSGYGYCLPARSVLHYCLTFAVRSATRYIPYLRLLHYVPHGSGLRSVGLVHVPGCTRLLLVVAVLFVHLYVATFGSYLVTFFTLV